MLTKIVVDFRNLLKFRNANGECDLDQKIDIKFCGFPNNIGRRMGESPSGKIRFDLRLNLWYTFDSCCPVKSLTAKL